MLKTLGYSRKKAYRTVACQHSADDMRSFCDAFNQANGEELVCIDETGFYVGDTPKRGYSMRGRRLNVASSRNLRCSKYSVIMAVSRKGVVMYDVLDHNCKKADFLAFFERLNLAKDTTVLLDNIRFHHSKETLELAKAKAVSLLFTPPYSPRFNAIEQVFAMLKHSYRQACPVHASRDFDYLQCIRATCARFTHTSFDAFFDHAAKNGVAVSRDVLLGRPVSGYDST
jgi:transposase